MAFMDEKGPAYGLRRAIFGYLSGSTRVTTEAFYPRSWTPNPQLTTLVFEGGDTSQDRDLLTRIAGTLVLDKQDLALISRIYGKQEVATPASGIARGVWMGDAAEVSGALVDLTIDLEMTDESGVAYTSETQRYHFPRGIAKVVPPSSAEYQGKHTVTLNISFERTATAIDGTALTGVPADGAYYTVGIAS